MTLVGVCHGEVGLGGMGGEGKDDVGGGGDPLAVSVLPRFEAGPGASPRLQVRVRVRVISLLLLGAVLTKA